MDLEALKELLLSSNILFYILHGLLALWGFVDCFFGFKLFKMTLSFFGLLFGAAVGAQLSAFFFPEQLPGLLGLSLICALLGAASFYRLYKVGLFFLGAWLGVVLLFPLLSSYEQLVQLLVLGVGAFIGGIITVYAMSYMIIVATAVTGGFRVVLGVAFFQGGPNIFHLLQPEEGVSIQYTDKLVLISLVVGLLGLLLQLRYYRKSK